MNGQLRDVPQEPAERSAVMAQVPRVEQEFEVDTGQAPREPNGKSKGVESPRIDLQVAMSEDDLLAFNRVWAELTGDRARAVLLTRLWSLLPIVGGVVLLALGEYVLAAVIVVLGLALLLTAGPYYRFVMRKAVQRQLEGRNPCMIGTRRIVIDKTGVFDGGRYDRMQIGWPAVVSLVVGGQALYVFYGSSQAVIVPRRSFRSNAEFERTVAIVERFFGRRAEDRTKVR